jgi:pimeloyl-ACP methyl ester carboxylesterase
MKHKRLVEPILEGMLKWYCLETDKWERWAWRLQTGVLVMSFLVTGVAALPSLPPYEAWMKWGVQAYFRKYEPPLLAVWGRNDPFFLPAGAEAYKRDIPAAEVHFYDTGHFALERMRLKSPPP